MMSIRRPGQLALALLLLPVAAVADDPPDMPRTCVSGPSSVATRVADSAVVALTITVAPASTNA